MLLLMHANPLPGKDLTAWQTGDIFAICQPIGRKFRKVFHTYTQNVSKTVSTYHLTITKNYANIDLYDNQSLKWKIWPIHITIVSTRSNRSAISSVIVQTFESLVITDIYKEVDAMDIKSNYSKIPNVAFELGLNCKQLAVFLYLCRCANNGQTYPTYDTIAQKTGMSSRTVKRIIPQLEEMGIIKKK